LNQQLYKTRNKKLLDINIICIKGECCKAFDPLLIVFFLYITVDLRSAIVFADEHCFLTYSPCHQLSTMSDLSWVKV